MEVPGHRQKQLKQTLTVRLLKTHFFTPILEIVKGQHNKIELVTRPGVPDRLGLVELGGLFGLLLLPELHQGVLVLSPLFLGPLEVGSGQMFGVLLTEHQGYDLQEVEAVLRLSMRRRHKQEELLNAGFTHDPQDLMVWTGLDTSSFLILFVENH